MPSPICPTAQNQDPLSTLYHVLEMAMHTAEAASADANHRIVLQAIREAVKIITLIYKMACPSGPKPETRDKKASLPAKTPSPGTQPPPIGPSLTDLEQDLFKEIFSSLAQPPVAQPATANRKLETDQGIVTKREKSGKIPKKKRLLKKYRQENKQQHCQESETGGAGAHACCLPKPNNPDHGPGHPAPVIRWHDEPVTLAAAGPVPDQALNYGGPCQPYSAAPGH